MAIKRHSSPSYAAAQRQEVRGGRQQMRRLLGHLAQSLPAHQAAFQSVCLLHFQQAASVSLPIKRLKGA